MVSRPCYFWRAQKLKFKYTGEAPEGEIVQCGVVFKPNEVSEITDEADAEMLKGHPFFELVGDDAAVPGRRARIMKKAVTGDDEIKTDDDAN